jgi:effector-binding domain-containing protein
MCEIVTKEFKIVGVRNKGLFEDYAELVPRAAHQFLQNASRIQHNTGIEVTVYEPKADENHAEGTFFVGLLVNEQMDTLPEGMEYLHLKHSYAVIKGKGNQISSLYSTLDRWIENEGYERDTPEHNILEVYHPVENDVEEVEIHIPVEN